MDVGSCCAALLALVLPLAYGLYWRRLGKHTNGGDTSDRSARRGDTRDNDAKRGDTSDSGAKRGDTSDNDAKRGDTYGPTDEELSRRFLGWRLVEITLFCALWPLFGFLLLNLLRWWARLRRAELFKGARELFLIGDAFWIATAAVLGMACAHFALRLLLRSLLSHKTWPLFDLYHDSAYGFCARKVTGWLMVACASTALIGVALGANCYLRIDGEGVSINGLFTLRELRAPYPWVLAVAQVRGIGEAQGHIVPMPHYVLFLRDGTRHYTLDLPGPSSGPAMAGPMQYVARRCGRPLMQLRTVAEVLGKSVRDKR